MSSLKFLLQWRQNVIPLIWNTVYYFIKIISRSFIKKLIQVTKMTQVIALFISEFFYDMSNLHFPPREPPFEPKPSLYPVCEYLIEQCIKRYAKEKCPLCNERVLPQKPEVRCFFWFTVLDTSETRCMWLGWLLHKLSK